LLFDPPEFIQSTVKEAEMFCEDGNRLILSYEKIVESISLAVVDKEPVTVKVKIVNCLSVSALASLL